MEPGRGLIGTLTDRGETGAPEFIQGAQHVENDPGPADGIEPQPAAACQGQDAVTAQRPELRSLHVIGGDVVLLPAGGGGEP